MLTRFITRPSHLRLLTLISSPNRFSNPRVHLLHTLLPAFPNPYSDFYFSSRCFSSDHKNNGGGNRNDQPTSTTGLWKISPENDQSVDSVFGEDSESIEGISGSHPTSTTDVWKISTENDQTVDSVFGDDTGSPEGISGSYEQPKLEESWLKSPADRIDAEGDLFKGIEKEVGESTFGEDNIFRGIGMEVERGGDDWARADGYKSWTLGEEEKGRGAFDFGEDVPEMRFGDVSVNIENREEQIKKSEEDKRLQEEEKVLSAVLKGPNRAFGDLIATSGITDAMLDGLLILKDLDDVPGLPPLQEIEDIRYEKNTRKSSRADIERQKQEEVANARVRQVDENGRAYGTGRRKCSVARVWVEPGDGRFVVNDKEFDIYFPMLDHRAALLRPFSETKTLGLWDVRCTVKGGGVSGQVGAIQLGISKALQNWEPDLRPPLRAAGFLTRDPRVVERKKPGKAKARKSFQWVKR